MATIEITGNLEGKYAVTSAPNVYNMHADCTIVSGTYGIEQFDLDGNIFNIAGRIKGTFAIAATGDQTTVNIAEGGWLEGMDGISLYGNGATVINDGTISAAVFGCLLEGASPLIFNSGTIFGTIGVATVGPASVTNAIDGRITGEITAIELSNGSSDVSTVTNHGLIEGGKQAVFGSGGGDTVINSGRMVGDVDLYLGSDLYDGRGGTVRGRVFGGSGNDIVITDSARIRYVEAYDQGFDALKSTVSITLMKHVERLELIGKRDISGTGTVGSEEIQGNAGDNILKGLADDDLLHGEAGNDRLSGGGGADTFQFKSGDGRDVITDFRPGKDNIYVDGLNGIIGFQDLVDNHARQRGDAVVIKAGKDTLTLLDVNLGDLDAGDFIF